MTYGPDLLKAFLRIGNYRALRARGALSQMLGKQVLLSGCDVEKLFAARARYGSATPRPDLGPESPVTSETVETERISLTRRELESLVDEAVKRGPFAAVVSEWQKAGESAVGDSARFQRPRTSLLGNFDVPGFAAEVDFFDLVAIDNNSSESRFATFVFPLNWNFRYYFSPL